MRQRASQAPQPDRARELGHVGAAGPEVELGPRLVEDGPAHGLGGRAPGDARGATGAAREVALRYELLVGLDDDPARDPELVREGAGGGEGRRGGEAAVLDRATEGLLELAVERPRALAIERHVQLEVGTGPRSCH